MEYRITKFQTRNTEKIPVGDGPGGGGSSDGYSPTVEITEIAGGHRVTVTDVNGPHTFDVLNGADGDDYVLTATDKQDIAAIVVTLIPPAESEAY